MSLIYNQYAPASAGGYVRTGSVPAPSFVRRRGNPERPQPQAHQEHKKSPERHEPSIKKDSPKKKGFLDSILSGGLGNLIPKGISGVLPKGMDWGDILLLALFLLLYLESGDEDFLIILIVVAFSIFK